MSPELHFEINAAPSYEFVMSLCVVTDRAGRNLYDLGGDWIEDLQVLASSDLLAEIALFCGQSDKVWAYVLSLAYESPAPQDCAAFFRHLEGVDALEIRLRLLGYYVRYFRRVTPAGIIKAAAEGDQSAQRTFRQTSFPEDDTWQAALHYLLPLGADETKQRLLAIARRWYEQVFQPLEDRLLPILRRDAERLQALARTVTPERLLEEALNGIEYIPEPGIELVVLLPSVVLRPQIHGFEHHGVKLFVYPVSDESLTTEPDAAPPRLLRLTQAVGDERRLRILKYLTSGSYTLQELSNHFDIKNTTMLHHLVILRAAGLVRLRTGAGKRYSLRRAALADLAEQMETYLGIQEEEGES